MSDNAIEFVNVSKKFKKGEKFDSLRDLIPNLIKNTLKAKRIDELAEKEFWAVKDVSFELKKGEVLGIIGHNGAGKSTILKLLSRILKPTKGQININGRLSALIEVGAGFHEDLTGRENIYLNGTIMGMKKKEIDKKFDSIVEFSELEDFIDTPVKRYSSGMYVKLGFSVVAHLEPEILLIDEVLSVGDIAFQSKCINKISSLKSNGIPIVFISHNLLAVEKICNKAILISNGELMYNGVPRDVVQKYQIIAQKKMISNNNKAVGRYGEPYVRLGNREVEIKKVRLLNLLNEEKDIFSNQEELIVEINFETSNINKFHFAVTFFRYDGVYCYSATTKFDNFNLQNQYKKGILQIKFPKLLLLNSKYQLSVSVWDANFVVPYDLHERMYDFEITSNLPEEGIVHIPHTWNLLKDTYK